MNMMIYSKLQSPVSTLSQRTHLRYIHSSKRTLSKATEEVCSDLRQMSNIANCVYPRDKDIKCNLGTHMKGVVIHIGIFR